MKVTADNLGAWVLRCNPALTDPEQLFADGVDRWCVAANYRSRLMRAGQPVLLWFTAARQAEYPRGFWGAGTVTGEALFGIPATDSEPAADLHVPLHLTLWPMPVSATEVSAAGLQDIEVLTQPQMANPSFLTVEHYNTLRALLPS